MNEIFEYLIQIIRGCWRYRWQAMIAAWALCLAGWLAVYALPDQYESSASVYVDTSSQLARFVERFGIQPDIQQRIYMVRQELLSRPQRERVARETDLHLRVETAEDQEALIEMLGEKISITPGRGSEGQNLYQIAFRDKDRKTALAVVQTLVNSFGEKIQADQQTGRGEVNRYADEKIDRYKRLLNETDQAVARFKRDNPGIRVDERGYFVRLQQEQDALDQLNSDLAIAMSRKEALELQIRDVPRLLSGTRSETEEGMASHSNSPLFAIDARIDETEARLDEVLLLYTDQHPDVINLKEQLEQLQVRRDEMVSTAMEAGPNGETSSANPVMQSLHISLNEVNVEMATLRQRMQESNRKIRALQAKIDEVPELERQLKELTQNYEQYRQIYDSLIAEKERIELQPGAGSEVAVFEVIEPPRVTLNPVAPKRPILISIVLIFALGLAFVLAFVMQELRPVFSDVRTLMEKTGRPVLGVVSMTWLDRRKLARRLDISSYASVAAGLLIFFVLALLFHQGGSQAVRALMTAVGS